MNKYKNKITYYSLELLSIKPVVCCGISIAIIHGIQTGKNLWQIPFKIK